MRRHALPTLLAMMAASAMAVTSATAAPAAPGDAQDARIRLTGELVRTAAEPGQPAVAGLRTGGRLVPVAADGVADVPPGQTVTLDAAVPDSVTAAARRGTELRVRNGRGRLDVHRLGRADLDAASDSTPAGAGSKIAAASVDTALSPGSDALEVERVVSSSTTTQAYTPATRTITYVNVVPAGSSGSPMTATQIQQQVSGTDSFWSAGSRGQLRVSLGRTSGPLTSAYSCNQPMALWDDIARRVGYQGGANSSLVLKVPANGGCGHGLGTVGSNPNSGGYVYVSDPGRDVLAHEVGHNMSLEHADRLVCTSASDAPFAGDRSWGTDCDQDAYGDGQDIMGIDDMGTPSSMLSAPQALRTGMLESSAATTVGSGSTTVTLAPMAGRTGTRAAQVTNPKTGVTYVVEYRTASGLDRYNSWGHRTGVRVLRRNTDPLWGETVLLDPSPTGVRDADPVLDPGETLTSYDGALRVSTISADATRAVVRIDNSAPLGTFTRTADPKVNGTRGVGRQLTAYPGSWTPSPSRVSYHWKRNGIRISGATSPTYTPTTSDAGRYISVQVTVHRTGYTSATKTSARVGIPIYSTTRPSIIGTPKVGRSLYAKVGAWTPSPTSYAYQWYRGSTRISGATAKTYVLTSADAGQKVRVRVTARRSGYSSGYAWSGFTTTVQR